MEQDYAYRMTNSQADCPPPQDTDVDAETNAAPLTQDTGARGYPGSRDARFAAFTAFIYVLFLEIVKRVPGGHIGMILATTLASLLYTLVFTVYMARALRTRFTVGLV